MPRVFLSPSTQEGNYYVNGGTEEQYMNLLCDQVIPYLIASGISYTRNDPNQSAAAAIRQANAGTYGLYVAMHSNAAPEGQYGTKRGCDVFYYRYSQNSRRAAELFAANLRLIYPLPQKVRIVPTETLGEVARTRAPAVLLEIGYHDNFADARWIEGNREAIARQLGLSLTEFFGLPFIEPMETRYGTVVLESGSLLLRSRPDQEAGVVTRMPAGASVSVHGEWQGWYVVHYGVHVGYAAARYIQLG